MNQSVKQTIVRLRPPLSRAGSKTLIIFPTFFFLLILSCPGADISTVGSWNSFLGPEDLQLGAGSSPVTGIESCPDQILISITAPGGDPWKIEARLLFSTLPTGIRVLVRRSGRGSGTGEILGGTFFQAVEEEGIFLCGGEGERIEIPIQLRLEGLSVLHSPGSFSIDLNWRVIEE